MTNLLTREHFWRDGFRPNLLQGERNIYKQMNFGTPLSVGVDWPPTEELQVTGSGDFGRMGLPPGCPSVQASSRLRMS